MKPSARYQACVEILSRIEASSLPMDLVVGDYMRNKRYIGSGDRSFIADMVYQIMRYYGRLHWYCEQAGISPDARMLVCLYLCVAKDKDVNNLLEIFTGERYAPAELSREEKETLIHILERQAEFQHNMPLHVKVECPDIYKDQLQNYFGEDFENEMMAFLIPASLDLRVNIGVTSRQEIIKSLEKDCVKVDKTPYSPWGLRCADKVYLGKTKAFRNGQIEIQDEGSQLIACVSGVRPGMQVLDYCAGGGGKTLAMAAAMAGKGRLVATDIEGRRLIKANQRLKRAGARDIVELRPLDEKRHARWFKRQTDNFDVVLADVPCSGTGTWRRNPDSRWFQYGPDLQTLLSVQAEILETVAKAVKPGGRLIYATCSILNAENDDQITNFLDHHPEFEIVPISQVWPGSDNCPEYLKGQDFMKLTPRRTQTDGFFAAVLKRR